MLFPWLRRLALGLAGLCLLALSVQSAPALIKTGAFVTSLSNVAPADGSFQITTYLWFVGPPDAIDPLRDIQILARTASVKQVARQILPDGRQYTALEVEAVVNQQYDLRHYPFDRQALTLTIEAMPDASKILLVADTADSGLADVVTLPVWRMDGLRLEAGTHTYDTGFGYRTERPTFSRLALVVDIWRGGSFMQMEKFTGFLVALVLTGLALIVPPTELGTRVGIMTSSIFAAVFNRYRLDDRIGFDPSFGLVDQISLLTFSAILTMLVVSLYSHSQSRFRPAVEVVPLDRRLGGSVLGAHVLLVGLAVALALA